MQELCRYLCFASAILKKKKKKIYFSRCEAGLSSCISRSDGRRGGHQGEKRARWEPHRRPVPPGSRGAMLPPCGPPSRRSCVPNVQAQPKSPRGSRLPRISHAPSVTVPYKGKGLSPHMSRSDYPYFLMSYKNSHFGWCPNSYSR